MQKCKVIAIANQKGGVGKTTTTLNLAIGLAKNGFHVLTMDFDPQGDLTLSLGWKNSDEMDSTIKDNDANFAGTVLHHPEGIDVIPSNIDLSDFETRLVNEFDGENILKNCLAPIKESYDYVLIDCPPSLAMLTINALSAADEVLIPVQTQYLPAKGMTKLLRTVSKVQRKINSNLKIAGVAITLADLKTNLAKDTIEMIHENFGQHFKVFNSVIPVAVKASEATVSGKSVYSYARDSKVAVAYDELTKEVIHASKEKRRSDLMRQERGNNEQE